MSEAYDFLVIGGGSAGSVIASRLSENPDVSVCLLEAGGSDRHPFFHLPAGFAKMTKGIGSWGWTTTPQKHMQNKVFTYTQAKVIGGGSAINAQIYTRGHPLDYDEWRQMGCEGWSYEEVLPYFRKSEATTLFGSIPRPGRPAWRLETRSAVADLRGVFRSRQAELGIPRSTMDINGERCRMASAYYQLTQKQCAPVFGGDGISCTRTRGRANLHRKARAPHVARVMLFENGAAR